MTTEPDPAISRIAPDVERVVRDVGWTDAEVRAVRPFGDGHSGFTYALDIGHDGATVPCVLRLSPPGARIAGPADVGRQGRVMAALASAGAPTPRIIAYDSGPVVDGRAFALMELVEGLDWEAARAEHGDDALADAALEALARFQALPAEATGLAGEPALAPREDVERWARLLERCPPDISIAGRSLVDQLAAAAPTATRRPVLVHGDYHYGNLIFDGPSVAAVVDWEIAQLGEPLLDLGSLAVASIRRRYRGEPNPTGGIDVAPSELAARYGADPELAAWFVALTCFKYTAILGYNAELHRRGKRPDPIYDRLGSTIAGLLDDGERILTGGLDAAWATRAGAPSRP